MRWSVILSAAFVVGLSIEAEPPIARAKESPPFDGIQVNLGNLFRTSPVRTRSISAENFTGEKGHAAMATTGIGGRAARELGRGWKVSPFAYVKPNTPSTLAEIDGPGAIQQIWIAGPRIENMRFYVLRFYWDGESEPSVEAPMGDLFACGWGAYAQVSSLAVCVNPGSGLNCYWTMPFRKKA